MQAVKLKAAAPQFVTTIDGFRIIHFIHVRSKNPNALPLIITHGWPGSIIEQLKIIDPLINPAASGGRVRRSLRRRDSVAARDTDTRSKPAATGWDPIHAARAWIELMNRLGYTKFLAQGGDWGNAVTEQSGAARAAGIGRRSYQHACCRPGRHRQGGSCRCAAAVKSLSRWKNAPYDQLAFFYQHGLGYASEMANRPQTLYALADSPIGLAAWMLDHEGVSMALQCRAFLMVSQRDSQKMMCSTTLLTTG